MLAGKKRNGRPVAQGDQIFGWGIEFTLLLAQLTTKIFCRKPFSLKKTKQTWINNSTNHGFQNM
jgi:hypothetical protein